MSAAGSTKSDLARQVDAAQSILETPAAEESRRLERALAANARAVADAMLVRKPDSGASSIDIAGGVSIFAGLGSPMTQGLAMGLSAPVTAADLDAMEAHLCPTGEGSTQLEIGPFVDPSFPALLTERGYRVHEWQLVWTRAVPTEKLAPPPPELTVRRVRPGEEDLFGRILMAGFLETEDIPEDGLEMMRPATFSKKSELYLAFLGDEAIGGASLGIHEGVAIVNGSGVRPAFRRRGAQGALIRARLDRARELGCDIAYSSTLPGTASRRNMERNGFSVAYPKILMLKPA